MSLTQEEIDGLSPGIRDAVLWFNEQGWETCDSGDGSNHAQGMECANEFSHVDIVSTRNEVIDLADEIQNRMVNLEAYGLQVEAAYWARTATAIVTVCDLEKSGDFSRLSPAAPGPSRSAL